MFIIRLFAIVVMSFAGMFSLTMMFLFALIVGFKDETFMFDFADAPILRWLFFFAATANAAIVLLYLLEWNC